MRGSLRLSRWRDGALGDEIGRVIAREDARKKIWELEGYALAERLYLSERP